MSRIWKPDWATTWKPFAATAMLLPFDCEIFNLALEHGIGLDGALAGTGAATYLGIDAIRRLVGIFGSDDGPFLPGNALKPHAG
jgi:hypothetical protein